MNNNQSNDFNRRDFLKGSSMAAMMAMMGGIELHAEDAAKPADTNAPAALTKLPVGPPVKFGIIGMGAWGREVATELSRLPNAPVTAISDSYATSLRRAKEVAPKAEAFEDYKKLLASPEVQAVVVATPTHLHKEIVLAALAAGKHVYCEAPLAHTIEDAKAIAAAAKAAFRQVFQSGLQLRADPLPNLVNTFVRAGATGRNVMARAQYHKKQSWKRTSPNPDREAELNWRLSKKISTGLVGEVGIHQVDLITWFMSKRPKAVTGFNSTILWDDGRDVPDTIEAVFEYPGGANLMYDATIANSFDADYAMFYGEFASVMMRGSKAWMFKEVDSPLLGWEVYARKDSFFGETGITLAVNATNQSALKAGEKKAAAAAAAASTNAAASTATAPAPSDVKSPLYFSLETFTWNAALIGNTITDYIDNFKGGDKTADFEPDELKALQDQVAQLSTIKQVRPHAGWNEGLEATVIAIKANEAVMKKERVVFQDEWFKL